MKIHYQIEFLSDWHVGSGLDAGPNIDQQLLKDEADFPYLPGRTVKGLLRDALQDLAELSHRDYQPHIDRLFGIPDSGRERDGQPGQAVFSNARLSTADREELLRHQLVPYLYRRFSSTAIDAKTGTADDATLRSIETCIPLKLYGFIEAPNWTEEERAALKAAFRYLRHLGVQRNRGLGRCRFT